MGRNMEKRDERETNRGEKTENMEETATNGKKRDEVKRN